HCKVTEAAIVHGRLWYDTIDCSNMTLAQTPRLLREFQSQLTLHFAAALRTKLSRCFRMKSPFGTCRSGRFCGSDGCSTFGTKLCLTGIGSAFRTEAALGTRRGTKY